MTRARHSSLLNNLGVLEHRNPAALGKFAFERDCFAARVRQLIVHRFVFADYQIGFAVFDDSNRATVLDALRATTFSVLSTDGVVIEIAHHVDDLAGDRFFRSGVGLTVLVFGREREWRGGKRSDDNYRENSSESFETF